MTGRAGDLVDLELLDDDLDGWRENATAERDPGDWWKWLAFAAAAVALVGVVGSLWGGGETESVPDDAAEAPLTATVYPARMPENPAYTAQSWCYFTWQAAKGFERQTAAELRRAAPELERGG